MTPTVERLVERLVQDLAKSVVIDTGFWAVLMDAVEETGDPVETWYEILDVLTPPQNERERDSYDNRHRRAEIQGQALRLLFEGIARASYLYAVQLALRWWPEEGPFDATAASMKHIAFHGMNTAECGPAWEAQLLREQVEEVLGEHGNLERNPLAFREARPVEHHDEGITEVDAHLLHVDQEVREGARRVLIGEREFVSVSEERRHALWLSFAPEWMDELNEDGEYLTLISYGGGYQSAEADFLMVHNRRGEGEVWEKVAEPSHGAERECPLKDWDPIRRKEGRDRKVQLEESYCGENPGRECRLCGIAVGEEHGFIYIGEGATTVYRRIEEDEDDEG